MSERSDRFLLPVFFLLFSPSHCTPMDHRNRNSRYSQPLLFSRALPFTPSRLILTFPASFFIFVSSLPVPVPPLCLSCILVCGRYSSLCTHTAFLGLTAVHPPVPYCGALHHLHAFSVLQQNEFLTGPERRERSRKRR